MIICTKLTCTIKQLCILVPRGDFELLTKHCPMPMQIKYKQSNQKIVQGLTLLNLPDFYLSGYLSCGYPLYWSVGLSTYKCILGTWRSVMLSITDISVPHVNSKHKSLLTLSMSLSVSVKLKIHNCVTVYIYITWR